MYWLELRAKLEVISGFAWLAILLISAMFWGVSRIGMYLFLKFKRKK